MQNNLKKIATDTDFFLKKFFKTQKKSPLLNPMSYGLFSGGKKIRSKILPHLLKSLIVFFFHQKIIHNS